MFRKAFLMVMLTVGLPAAAYDLRHDASGAVVRWSRNVELVLDSRAALALKASRVEAAAREALSTLSSVTPALVVTLRVGAPRAIGYDVADPSKNQNDIVVLEEWPYDESALAATVVTVNGKTHEIVDTDIAFNTSNNAFAVLEGGFDSRLVNDVQNTLTHELGHALGLMHNSGDASVVMYPSAPPGETSKRVLASDDREGLKALYADSTSATTAQVSSAEGLTPVGCTASAGEVSMLALLAVLVPLARRGQPRVWVLLAMPSVSWAAAPALDFSKADTVAIGSVISTRTENRSGQFVTEVEVAVARCAKGRCPATLVVLAPGGKVGDFEQSIVDHPVPIVGEVLVVTRTLGRHRLFLMREPEVGRRVDLALATLLRGSTQPQSVELAPGPSTQPVGKTR